MKILMLTHKVPYPLHDGYNLHNYQHVRQLCDRHEIHLIALGEGEVPPEIRDIFASVRIVPSRVVPRTASPLKRLRTVLTAEKWHDFDPEVFRVVEQTVATHDFDLAWVSGDKMLTYTKRLALPVLGDMADDNARDLKSQIRRSSGPRQFARRSINWFKAHRYQRACLPHVSVCNMVSEADRDSILASVPSLEVTVVGNGTDSDYYLSNGTAKEPGVLAFEGSMDFQPNIDAAVYFCSEILPLIRERRSDARVLLVGRAPAPEVEALRGPGVEVTGFVDDVRPWLNGAEVFVAPLRSGTGIKNKMLQAWAMELPIVATTKASTGLTAVDGKNILIADEPRAFADAVLRLLGDADLRRELGERGRATVLEHYSWAAKSRELEGALFRVKEKGRPSGR